MLILILPAYNEAENLRPLLESMKSAMTASRRPYTVVLVDDGSTDATYEVARRCAETMPLVVLRSPVNEGLGGAMKRGLVKAAELAADDDVIVTMDADNTHKPGEIEDLLSVLDRGADVAIASRYRSGAEVHGLGAGRRFLSRGAGLLFQLCCPIEGVRDYTCGFRAYRGAILKKGLALYGDRFFSESGFSCTVDIILKLHGAGARFGEAPFVLQYDAKKGRTKMRVGKTIVQTLILLVKHRFRGAPR